MKKIFLPLAAIALAMVCATGCKNGTGSDKDSTNSSAVKADAASKGDVTARVNRLGDLQIEIQEIEMSLQEELVEKARTLSPKEFAAYYEKFCNAQLDIQQRMASKDKDMEARAAKLKQVATGDSKVQETMNSPEVQAVDERIQQRMKKFYEEHLKEQMQMQMAPAADSLATA